MICLGIESSCDETALALVQEGKLMASVLATQVEMHALFGGVVPELASREHYRYMGPLFDTLLRKANITAFDIDAFAVSRGPGLLGALLVGVSFAKGLALATQKPLVGVNHLHAHLLAAGLEHPLRFPALGVLVSGGHTHLYRMDSEERFTVLGRTLDDAAGEAFDKVGKVLGLAYPAGRAFDALAQRGIVATKGKALFPRPFLDNDNVDFSFSGLKTAATLYISKHPEVLEPYEGIENAPQAVCDMCAAFTQAVVDTLCIKTERALERQSGIQSIIMAGGVAANSHLRTKMQALAQSRGLEFLVPSPSLCTDNASMVAYAGWLYASRGLCHDLSMEAVARGQNIPEDWCKI